MCVIIFAIIIKGIEIKHVTSKGRGTKKNENTNQFKIRLNFFTKEDMMVKRNKRNVRKNRKNKTMRYKMYKHISTIMIHMKEILSYLLFIRTVSEIEEYSKIKSKKVEKSIINKH